MPQGDPRLRGDDMGQKRGGGFPLPFSMDPIPYRYAPGSRVTERFNMKHAFFVPI